MKLELYTSAIPSLEGAFCPEVLLTIGALIVVPASAAASIRWPSATIAESDDKAEPDGADIDGVGCGDSDAEPPTEGILPPPLTEPVGAAAVGSAPPTGAGVVLVPFAICRIFVGSPPTAIILRRTASSVTGLPDA